ncbi:MAG TPA: sulfatase-like hydrolase/transferase, partial [Candidatus Saccharimonadales bacterium]
LFESTGSYLPCWLEEAGYSTMLAGKYLNEYPFGQPKTFKQNLYVPPCWTEWYGMNYAKSSSEDPVIPGSGGLLYQRYLNHDEIVLNQHGRVRFVQWRSSNDNPYLEAGKADGTRSMARPSGEVTREKKVKSVYATDVVTNRTRSFIRRKSEAGQPFFAFVSMYAPHMGAYPHPADALDPVDVCALKPGLADRLHGGAPEFLTTGDNTFWSDTPCDPARRFYGQPADQTNPNDVVGNQVMALRRVDRAVTRIVDELKAAGTFDNTYLVFMSDQGLTWGERGMLASKQWPYSEAIRIPFGVVGPSIQPRFTNAVVSTIDLAPTILGWAGTSQNDHVFDGVDFGQYLHGLGPKPRAAIIEMPRKLIKGQLLLPAWVATWSVEFHIVDYDALDPLTGNDNREVFDLHLDPFETRNLWSPDN